MSPSRCEFLQTTAVTAARVYAAGSPHAPGQVERVTFVGATEPLSQTRDAQGLHLTLPERRRGDYVYAFEISGSNLARGG